ncbi:MAG: biotin transporter BioY, partial [Firmicutes bacterium]|nr:biotin transporter BioY [Bacillota bacterium]
MPSHVRYAVLAGLIAALTAVGALTTFTLPFLTMVPFTLQMVGVYLAGTLLPPRWAFVSESAYVFLGVIGLPIFADGAHGILVLVGPYGGYLWGYPFAAAASALILNR